MQEVELSGYRRNQVCVHEGELLIDGAVYSVEGLQSQYLVARRSGAVLNMLTPSSAKPSSSSNETFLDLRLPECEPYPALLNIGLGITEVVDLLLDK